jgi:amino acid adenylation domain-containing protein
MSDRPRDDALDELSPDERRALLVRLLEERRAATAERPVSDAQRRLWILDQLAEDGVHHNTPVALRLTGSLDEEALHQALEEVVARHETLRTSFATRDGEPVQVVAPPGPVARERVDLTALPDEERPAALLATAHELISRPFDLGVAPLLRVRLVATAADEHVLVLAVHHIVFDGWSHAVLLRELRALYDARVAGRPSPLPPLPIQYGDYAVWQAEQLSGGRLESWLHHARERLAGATDLALATDHPRPPVQRFEARRQGADVGDEVARRLEGLSRELGASLFMTVLAAWNGYLARLTGQDDLVVGTPVAGRTRSETEGLVGCFINTVILRTDLSGDPGFRELVRRVRGDCLDAFEHAELPFERLVEELRPERDLSRNPLFQVLFMLQEGGDMTGPSGGALGSMPAAGAPAGQKPGTLAIAPFELDSGTTRFDLEVYAFRTEDGLRVVLNHSAALFDDHTITRMLAGFTRWLERVSLAPDRALSGHPLLEGEERDEALGRFVGPALAAPAEGNVFARVQSQAERTPDAVAARCGAEGLTYRELLGRSCAVARRLRSLGVGPGDLVGLHLQRGLSMVVSTLGVMGAGAAYVPLDPGFPADRLRFMVADAKLAALVTDDDGADVPGGSQAPRVPLDARGELAHQGAAVPTDDASPATDEDDVPHTRGGGDVPHTRGDDDLPRATPDDVAYVIYTSGSTGRPKGVRITHRAAMNLLVSLADAPGLGPDDTLVAVTTLSFDISFLELFLPLSVGAQVVVATRDQAADGERLADLLDEVGATVLQATPATWRLLLAAGWPRRARLTALVGGEAWDWSLAAQLLERCEGVWNMYGPTETTVWSAVRRLLPEDGRVVVGGPLANTTLHVLDGSFEPVPLGVAGELCIGGDGLAEGYHGLPELTAERFVADPYAREPGARLYRTGDRVRALPDRTLEFLGRSDGQVKLRGHRIELGEIEEALAAHPAVAEAAADLFDPGTGEPALVAYTLSTDGAPTASTLRDFLRERLPEVMVPSIYVALDALPRTPNGKLDRSALPAPRGADVLRTAEHVPPRDALEQTLAEIWADVLNVDEVGAFDDFFDLGGHSLLAARVVSRIRDVFEMELPLAELFTADHLADLAARIGALRQGKVERLPALERRDPDEAPRPSLQQVRLWFLDRLDPGSGAYNMPMARRLRGALDVAALSGALDALVARHEVLRSTYEDLGGEPVVAIAPPGPVALPVEDLGGLPDADQEQRIAERVRDETRLGFDLAAGPLVRARLLRLGDEHHVLLLTLHHIVSDALSMVIVERDLSTAYVAARDGHEPARPALGRQYADFAGWQHACFEGGRMAHELDAWRQTLLPLPAELDLPLDHGRRASPRHLGGRETLLLDAPTVRGLRRLGRSEGASLFVVLLAAFEALLSRITGATDLIVGTPISGRTHTELEPLVGFFINTLPLRTDLSGAPTFRELTRRVRRTTLDAFQHQAVPFERLVEEVQPERDPSRNPIFGVFVNMLDVSQSEGASFPGLTVEPLGGYDEVAKFDLTLYLFVRGDEVSVGLNHDRDLFDRPTILTLLSQYRTLLGAVAEDADRPLGALPLLTDAERSQRDSRRAPSPITLPFVPFEEEHQEQSVGARFAQVVARGPERLALDAGSERWTYGELDARAGAVAAALTSARAPGGDDEFAPRVVLLVEETGPAAAAALGVLRAGCAYVPLDPSHPEAWLAEVVDDTSPVALVADGAHGELARRLAAAHGGLAVRELEALWSGDLDAGANAHGAHAGSDVSPDALASIRYTSGSSGRPKGVMQSHRGMLAQIRAYTNSLHLGEQDRLSALSSFTHDSGLMDVYGALLNGAVLCPLSLKARSPEQAVTALVDAGVTVFHATPTVFRYLLASRSEELLLPTARLAVFGGEALNPEDLPLFRRHFGPDALLVHGLGASECSQGLQFFLSTQADCDRPRVPVGQAIEGVEAVIVDDDGAPVDGLGELAFRSDHVALGYWRRPELTAAVFSEGPAGRGRVRTWRTGDRARRLPDGGFEWLGRRDDQLKIRGLRVEPAGVAIALEQREDVARAAVVARRSPAGETRLVAYVVPAEGASRDERALGASLRLRFPEVSVPSSFVWLDELPLTAGGKLDRSALPSPEEGPGLPSSPSRPPETETEVRLAQLFAEVLDIDPPGADESFFAMGGHSLLATRVVSRVADAYGIELPLAEMFDRPTVERLAACVVERLQARGGAQDAVAPLASGGAPTLSFGQQRFWFLEQLQVAVGAYALHTARHLAGELDRDALARALSAVVARHEVLRSRFPEGPDGEPTCVVQDPAPVELELTDLSELEPTGRRERLDALAERSCRAPFDVAHGPLVRFALARLADDDHVVLVTLHHILGDAWSMDVFWRELGVLYAAELHREPSPLPPLRLQYSDFAHWQRERLSGARLDELLAWWSTHLQGAPPLLELPTDRPRPALESMEGARCTRTFEAGLTTALNTCAERHEVTLFMVLMAGLQALLHRDSGQDDVVVGVPVAGRIRAEFEELIGLFVNTLPLRGDVSGDPTFAELLARVRAASLGGFAHQELPFEQLVRELRPTRALSHHPLFQVMLVVQNAPRSRVALQGLDMAVHDTRRSTSPLDLTLFAWETDGRLTLTAEYKTELFDAATVERVLGHLEGLLSVATADPGKALSALGLLEGDERRQVLEAGRGPVTEVPDVSLLELLDEPVRRSPHAPALHSAQERRSYAELDARARGIARHLAALGLGRGSRVAVCLGRGPELVEALLGILRCGAAYVPLDPSHPPERLAFVLEDVGAQALVTRSDVRPESVPDDVPTLLVDELGNSADAVAGGTGADASSGLPSEAAVSPDDTAYVIYTSGSTGRPKGVEITHRSVVNFLLAMRKRPGLSSDDVLLSVTTIAFDIAVLELLGPLTVGALVVLTPADVASDGLRLEALLSRSRATLCQATPATWRLLLEARWAGDRRLKLLCGGEAWSRALADELLPRCASLWNMYGPTETTIWSAVQQVTAGDQPVAIGEPIDNTTLYVLDPRGEPVPEGVPGELCIGGLGLARGYWNRPELTARVFIADPFDSAPGARLYRTGDRVRRRADGTLDFLGRLDHQVKVQGFRIELGEIESVFGGLAGVVEAVASTHEVGAGDVRLVVHVVLEDGHEPEVEVWRQAAGERLPDYMVPGQVLVLDAIPRTPNGKVDRNALPAPSPESRRATAEAAAPETPTERLLAGIWEDLLGVEGVGIQDNFFDLGGHSLLAMRAVVRLEHELGVRVNPGEFILQTLGQVAASADRAAGAGVPEPGAEGAGSGSQEPPPARAGGLGRWARRLLGRDRPPPPEEG